MKLLCLPIAFLYAVVKGQLASRTCLFAETLILTVEAGQRMFSRQLCYRKLCEFVKRKSRYLAT